MDFEIGQIFENEYPAEAIAWCKRNNATILETLPLNGVRRFQIQEKQEYVPTKEDRIAELKTQLSDTDYKIVKCSEYSLAGEELPYNITELHTMRQAIRDQINELEAGDE